MWIILLSFFRLFVNCHSTYGLPPFLCHEEESSSLLKFKQSIFITDMDGTCPPSTDISSWNLGTDCCSWDGVQCNNDTGHVIALHLSNSCIHGSINSTATLFRLIHLTRLNLSLNYFSGQIPPAIFLLSNLVSLDLSDNPLKLQNPGLEELAEKFPSLIELNLNGVNISSIVPQSFTNLSSLSALRLRDCNLQGEFPAGIFHLPNLRFLILRHNPNLTGNLPEFQSHSPIEMLRVENTSFSGEVPESIGNLKSLNNFGINECNFSGKLPISIGSLEKMEILVLSGNYFSGTIPTSIANLHKLTYLSLSNNNFGPQTLHWVGNLTNLEYLDLTNTNSYGEIPSWFGNFTKLTWIQLASNSLHGPIPDSIFTIPQLQVLVLYSNRLNGTLSSDSFLNSTSLSDLQLSDNNLSLISSPNYLNRTLPKFESLELSSCKLKEFPFFLRGQNQLEILDLSQNQIVGLIPGWISDLATESLQILNLGSNFLSGFEQDFNVLPRNNLHVLNLSANQFEGSLPIPPPWIFIYIASQNKFSCEIPQAFCNLTSISTLDLSNNKLSGTLPQCLGQLSSFVVVLDLRHNSLSGEIPDGYTNGCAVRMMDLSQNRLGGTIPRSLTNCTKLESLNLGENRISDVFPHWLGVLPELKLLILRSNGLTGEMGKHENSSHQFPKLRIVDLSGNNLTGKLPSEYFKNWIAMKTDDRSSILRYLQADVSFQTNKDSWINYFSYSITITNKGKQQSYDKILEIFTAIDLSRNRFEGEIPQVIGNLKQIELLNLSGNILTGHIPSSLANLKEVEALDLSVNKLSGEIPVQFSQQLTFLSFFNVSHNNLTGSVPRGNQFNTFENDSFLGNVGLCGIPLSRKCGDMLPPQQDQDQSSSGSTEFEFGWKVVLMGYACGSAIGVAIGCTVNIKKHRWFTKKFTRWQQLSP